MTTINATPEAADGYVISNNSNTNAFTALYSTVRAAGTDLAVNTISTVITVGQRSLSGGFQVWEGFIGFDTSVIPDDAIITGANLFLWSVNDSSDTNFDLEVYPFDWGTSLTTADWRNPDTQISVANRVCYIPTALGYFTAGAYSMALNDPSTTGGVGALAESINKTGSTRFVLMSSRQRGNNTPPQPSNEFVQASSTDTSGSSQDPILTIAYEEFQATVTSF